MRVTWLCVLLLLAALGVSAQEQQTPQGDSAQLRVAEEAEQEPSPLIEELVENATMSAAFSGCGLCQQTGQCDHAFRGQAGQFCLGMASGAPCCCPLDAQCAASPYECRCRRVAPSNRYGGGGDYHPSSQSGGSSGTFIFFVLLLLCCVCCCYLPARRAQRAREEQYAYAQPVASQYGTYPGQQQQPYAYASAPVAYESNPYNNNGGGGGNTLAAGALGALGGLGAGAALGSMFGGGRSGNNNFGGDTGGASQNSYSFSGDTGGGDFGGDDGGTFAGDS
ncbi:hypothetical protein BBJ28_00013186 [Nothophytophthora sp. Chile5]|nr:hypothetical protein BBJ28_00013186 [Nothophytophthora sp. Chile5]